MSENMTVVTSTPTTMTVQNNVPASMAPANAQTINIIGGDQYPVSSVNGKTGAVVLNAGDVGAVTTNEFNAFLANLPQTIADSTTDIRSWMIQNFSTPLSATDVGDSKLLQFDVTGESTVSESAIENTGETLNLSCVGKNLFDADTVLPALRSTDYPNARWVKQADGSFYSSNVAELYRCVWYKNTAKTPGSFAISVTERNTGTTDKTYLRLVAFYTDNTKQYIAFNGNVNFKTYTAVTDSTKTLDYVMQSYGYGSDAYVKDIMIAHSADATYEPYQGTQYTVTLTDSQNTAHTMRKTDRVAKHDDGKWYFEQNAGYIASYGSESVTMILSSTGSLTTGAKVLYRLPKTLNYELDSTAQAALNSIVMPYTYADIHFTNAVAPVMSGKYRLDDKAYIDNKFADLQALVLENNA